MLQDTETASGEAPETAPEQELTNLLGGGPSQPDPAETGEQDSEQSEADDPAATLETEDEATREGQEAETEDSQTDEELPVDLESLTSAQLLELESKLKNGAGKRIAELTRKRKEAEEMLAAAQADQGDPLAAEPDQSANPYKDVETIDDLRKSATDLRSLIENLEATLDDSDGLMPDDMVDFNGQDYAKKELRRHLRDARKSEQTHLPAQLKVIQNRETAAAQRQAMQADIESRFDWISSEDKTPEREVYERWMQNPEVESLREHAPGLWASMPGLMAYAAAEYARGQNPAPAKPATIPSPKAPATPTGAAAKPSGEDIGQTSKIKGLVDQFQEGNGRADDFTALLTATQ